MRLTAVLFLATSLAILSTAPAAAEGEPDGTALEPSPIVLREGDQLQITFPGAPNLNTAQRIRSDGRISLPLIGEVEAVGMSPMEFQEKLAALYASQLVSNEVFVVLLSRSFYVYINGAVGRTGRNDFDQPVDLLEAIMAAGFNDETANLKNVQVIRLVEGQYKIFTENLQLILDGRQHEPFMLEQGDMILVPRRWL